MTFLLGEASVSKEGQEENNDTEENEDKEDKPGEEGEEEKEKSVKSVRSSLTSLTDLEELLFCRSPNQIRETLREYQQTSHSQLAETIRMEFSELKAEAFCSLG